MEVKIKKRSNHRPKEMEAGKRRNVYIDEASWLLAQKLGEGNGSEGIRHALRIASEAA
jgi:hypothetical protein